MSSQMTPNQQGYLEGTWIRGGTSNGLFVPADRIPADEEELDTLLLEMFGSPDPLQVNGIGGSKSHTSKFMAIENSDRDGVDVEYTFSQVPVTGSEVDRSGNCGNLTSAIGMAAILYGLADPIEPITELTLYNTNTDTVVEQKIPVTDGEPAIDGDYSIDGVPGTGAKIASSFIDPTSNVTGSLFPSGNRLDTLTVDGKEIDVTIIDATNVNVFVRAEDIEFDGTELPAQIEGTENLEFLEAIRSAAADRIGFDGHPGIAFVSEPQSYPTSVDTTVDAAEIDITARYISLQPHHAYAMTGAMALAAATQLDGTIPNEAYRPQTDSEGVTIGHPKGYTTIDVKVSDDDHVERITNYRTARPISKNKVFYRRSQVE